MQNAKCKISIRFVCASVITLSIVFSACRDTSNGVADEPNSSIPAMRVVTDDLGRTVLVPVKVTRVISTAPSVTEMIFAAGGGDRLVGVTTFCNYPEEANLIAKIGDTMNPNMETIVALKPDVVFVSTASQIEAFAKTLEQNGIAVYVTNPDSLDGVFKNLRQLGELFGTSEQAEKLVTDLRNRVSMIVASTGTDEKTRVFVQISKEPLFTIGKESFLTSVIRKVYGESVTANVETAYPKLSKETALALQPEVIILSASDDNREPNEVFKNSPAVKNGRVYSIDADILSRPGPRLVDALEQIARLLHPEKFN
jgi:iron complex transport system substrate-binding protein